ncbi:auxin-responsive protein IAA25-like [Typha latifolia]|uniref:auxin-responsive protein IAA25-like n=1 Tax=Typha latifolia TaxID=4733 RepID=UPI003C2DC547
MKTMPFESPPRDQQQPWSNIGFHKEYKLSSKQTNTSFHGHLELSLGISSENTFNTMASRATSSSHGNKYCMSSRWSAQNPTGGYVHPWSLAARQQKAVAEQARQNANPSSSSCSCSCMERATHLQPIPAVVGWPPVCTFRRNLVSTHQTKSAMDSAGSTKSSNTTERNSPVNRPTMFVKVHMQGFVVGRKVNLMAHDSYDSLSFALRNMFSNYLSINEEEEDAAEPDLVLLYEDHEGDRMLVGDVPWDLFIASVKRLYIIPKPKPKENAGKSVEDEKEREEKD